MITELNEINTETEEGKLLIAAISKIMAQMEINKTFNELLAELNEALNRV